MLTCAFPSARRADGLAVAGALVWLTLLLARLAGWIALGDLQLILLCALLLITPLALPLALSPVGAAERPGGPHSLSDNLARLVMPAYPVAALSGAASLLLAPGALAGACACIWLLFTGLAAVVGAARLLPVSKATRGVALLAEVCVSLALVYLPIGAGWLLASRLSLRPLAFSQTTVQLTAIHFHYIPLAALLLSGLLGRAVLHAKRVFPRRLYQLAAIGMIVSPLLVAAGITLSQVSGARALEAGATVLLTTSMITVAALTLCSLVFSLGPALARGLLAASSVAVLFTMAFALAYALGAATGAWTITIAQMILVHGWVNTVAFGLCGLLGYRLLRT
jgi:hypothetical protein